MKQENLEQKKDRVIHTCPICRRPPKFPNRFVRYHVRYGEYPIVILACKYCNFAEYGLRTGEFLTKQARFRIPAVLSYQRKFGIEL